MGTRSLTKILNDADQEFVCIYRQHDGYPSGHGADLLRLLNGMIIGNGVPFPTPPRFANGMGCLAAQLVEGLKDGPGGIYLYLPGSDDVGEDYVYVISQRKDRLWLKITNPMVPIYDGFLDDLKPKKLQEEDED